MASKFREVVTEFADTTTAHGIGRIQSSKPILLKIIWAVIFLASTCVLAWQLHGLVSVYYQRPVSIKTTGIYESVVFPSVSFCNLNPIRASQLHLGGVELSQAINDFRIAQDSELTGHGNPGAAARKRKKRKAEQDVKATKLKTLNDNTARIHNTIYELREKLYNSKLGKKLKAEVASDLLYINDQLVELEGDIGEDEVEILRHIVDVHNYLDDESDEGRLRVRRQIDNITTTSATPATTTTTNDVQYDVADEYYVPNVDISNMPWFSDTKGESSAQASNTIRLTNAVSETPIQARREMGHQITEMLQECTWNGIVCTPLNFTSFYDKTYGNCFTFNSGFNDTEVLRTAKPGSVYGLSMTLYIDQNEYIDTLAASAGVRILVHGQNIQPFPVDVGFTAIPGQKTTMQLINNSNIKLTSRFLLPDINQSVVVKNLDATHLGFTPFQTGLYHRQFDLLPFPYGTCTETGTTELLLYNKAYSQLACMKSCYQNRTIVACGCANPELSVPMDAAVCTANDSTCIDTIKDRIANNEMSCDCPIACTESAFTSATSTSTWPGENFIERIQNLYAYRTDIIGNAVDNASMISKNFLKVEVFFNELKFEEVVETPGYQVTNLLADIGGQLGLWLGFSILTMAECVQLIIELVTFPCRKRNSEQKVTDSTTSIQEKSSMTFDSKIDTSATALYDKKDSNTVSQGHV